MPDKYTPSAHATSGAEVQITADNDASWLELGHLRALVAAADALGMPDDTDVTVGGVQPAYPYSAEQTIRTATCRVTTYTPAEEVPRA